MLVHNLFTIDLKVKDKKTKNNHNYNVIGYMIWYVNSNINNLKCKMRGKRPKSFKSLGMLSKGKKGFRQSKMKIYQQL